MIGFQKHLNIKKRLKYFTQLCCLICYNFCYCDLCFDLAFDLDAEKFRNLGQVPLKNGNCGHILETFGVISRNPTDGQNKNVVTKVKAYINLLIIFGTFVKITDVL